MNLHVLSRLSLEPQTAGTVTFPSRIPCPALRMVAESSKDERRHASFAEAQLLRAVVRH